MYTLPRTQGVVASLLALGYALTGLQPVQITDPKQECRPLLFQKQISPVGLEDSTHPTSIGIRFQTPTTYLRHAFQIHSSG